MKKELTLSDFKEVFELCSKIQSETQHVVFIDFSGHVNGITIRVCLDENSYQDVIYFFKETYSYVYLENISKKDFEDLLSDLQNIFDTANDRLLLAEKMNNRNILSEYKRQIELGVSKKRTVQNITKQFSVTHKKVMDIINTENDGR